MSLRGLRSRLHATFSLFTDFNHLLNSNLHLIVTKILYTLTVELGNACQAIRWQNQTFFRDNNLKSRQLQSSQRRRTYKSSRVSLYRPPMTVCGQNVDILRACKGSSLDFFRLSTGNTSILSSPVFLYITRGVLRCLLEILALWGQKPSGGNKLNGLESHANQYTHGHTILKCVYLCIVFGLDLRKQSRRQIH